MYVCIHKLYINCGKGVKKGLGERENREVNDTDNNIM